MKTVIWAIGSGGKKEIKPIIKKELGIPLKEGEMENKGLTEREIVRGMSDSKFKEFKKQKIKENE